jgi:hypothetical protein
VDQARSRFTGTAFARRSSKSGAVVTEVRDGRLVAARVGGRFWMCWGAGTAFAATSDDLVRWTPVTFDATGGQVGNVLFAQALVLFRGEWRLYLGLSDSRIGCATAPGSAPDGAT